MGVRRSLATIESSQARLTIGMLCAMESSEGLDEDYSEFKARKN